MCKRGSHPTRMRWALPRARSSAETDMGALPAGGSHSPRKDGLASKQGMKHLFQEDKEGGNDLCLGAEVGVREAT